jgi:hypothetical protein
MSVFGLSRNFDDDEVRAAANKLSSEYKKAEH